MKNRILTGVAVVFAGVIAFFAVGIFTGGGSVDKAVEHTAPVQAQPATTTTIAADPAPLRPAQQPRTVASDSGAVAELREDFVSWSGDAERIIQRVTDSQAAIANSQAANTAIIQELADKQATQTETACFGLLSPIIANSGTSSSSEGTDSSSRSSKTLMSELLASQDEGTGLGIVADGKLVCAIVKVDTGDANLEGEVSWRLAKPEIDGQ